MNSSDDFRSLGTTDWDQLLSRADHLEAAWKEKDDVDLHAFLPPQDDPMRTVVLHELLKTDLEIRWRRGLGTDLEHYVTKYPELGDTRALSAKLVYEEYRVRQCYGDKPALATYERRFPNQFGELQQLIADQPVPTESRIETVHTRDAESPLLPGAREGHSAQAARASASEMLSRGGGYRKIKRIGSGGFGEVWLAEAPGGVEVAIKIIFRPLDHEEAQRELQSLELIKRLRHPFLLATQGFWSEADRLNIVMELADGSLRDRLKECRGSGLTGIPVAELFIYFRESAEALDFLHRQHVLHRDIKPDNILLLQRHAKVADFGLARLQESQRLASVSGSGTPAYMAPEVWRGKASERSDQYSLAMSYAELRLDRRVFSGKDMMEIMLDHVEHEPNLASMPDAEKVVILRAMAKDPERRYGTCLEFVQSLQIALAECGAMAGAGSLLSTPAVRSPTAISPGGLDVNRSSAQTAEMPGSLLSPAPRAGRSRSRLLWAGLVVLLVGGFGAGMLFKFWPGVEEPQPPTPTEKDPDHRPEVMLPANCQRAGYAEVVTDFGGKQYYQRIVRPLPGGPPALQVEFVLIPQKSANDPPTFYIAKDKITNEVFRRFAKTNPGALRDSSWERGGKADGADLTAADHLPVMRVTVAEANLCARWLGGHLPTTKQWDRAAGYPPGDGGPGPFKGSASGSTLAVNRRTLGPRSVSESSPDDESPHDVREMASNGCEFTRNLTDGRTVPLEKPAGDDLIILRGQRYTATKPLLYEDLKYQQETPQVQYYRAASPYTGFRVVLEWPR